MKQKRKGKFRKKEMIKNKVNKIKNETFLQEERSRVKKRQKKKKERMNKKQKRNEKF